MRALGVRRPDNGWLPPAGSVIYQIYPATFQDSNADGFGDLEGVTMRLDYLAALGVDYIWLSPFYPSPQADGGYDISDYRGVDPRYGTIDDFKRLTAEAKKRGIGVVIDLVMNHTSAVHPWFKESRKSPESPKRDYYIWADKPNNWESIFGGSAWEKDPINYKYYLHTFLPDQPDLNWDNLAVRNEFVGKNGVLEFWAGLGVAGFRLDAVWWLSKNPSLSDDVKPNPSYKPGDYPYDKKIHENSKGWKNLYKYLNLVADKAASLNCFMLTEAYPARRFKPKDYMPFYRNGRPENSWPMMFELMESKWNAARIKQIADDFQNLLEPGDVPCYVLGNHDKSRAATRIGGKNAKAAMTLLLALPGKPVIYNGEEIGMTDTKIPRGAIRDPLGIRLKNPKKSRDPQRTPMQWANGRNAGFSRARGRQLWLPANKSYRHGTNVQDEAKDPHSILNHTRQLLRLRKKNAALRFGEYQPYETGHKEVFGFKRVHGGEEVLVLINFSGARLSVSGAANAAVLSSTHETIDKDYLAPHEARILQIY